MRLIDEGYDSYAVGGCIRDSILCREPHDWDITTAAKPEEVIRIFGEGDIHIIGTAGIRHGTVMLKAGDGVYEVTTFRCDGKYNDHRRPDSVSFSDTVEDDLSRRDFTMNAIAAKPSDEGIVIKDPFGGLSDIKKGIIRTVGKAEKRFEEDALRILRTIRFAANLGFGVEVKTAKAALTQYRTLEYISAERITSELWRFLEGYNAPEVARLFIEIFEWMTPSGLPDRFLKFIDETRNPYVRLALMLEHGSNSNEFFCRMRFSGGVISFVRSMLSIADAPKCRMDVCRFMRKFGDRIYAVAEYLRILRLDGVFGDGFVGDELIRATEAVISEGVPYLLSQLAVKGGDVIEAGVQTKCIGKTLEYLLTEVQQGNIPNERESLIMAIPDTYKIE